MAAEPEEDLPLHDEAKARSKWRGGETMIDKGDSGSGPASEIDNASQGGGQGRSSEDGVLDDLARRPPD